MKHIIIFKYLLFLQLVVCSQTKSRHFVSANLGAGTNFSPQNKTDCTYPVFWSMNAMYNYNFKKKYLLGFIYAGDSKYFNLDKLFKKLDDDTANFSMHAIQSSQMYFSTFMFGPTFGITKNIAAKTEIYFVASSGLVITIKQPVEATYYPYIPTNYTKKSFVVAGEKSSFSPYVHGSVGLRFSLMQDLYLNFYYCIAFFQANIGGVYKEKLDNNEVRTINYRDKFSILEHSLGIGITFSPGKW